MVSISEKQQGNDGKEITVIFGMRSTVGSRIPDNSILIAPSNDDWNDFKFRTRVNIRIRLTGDEDDYETYGFIGFITSSPNEPNGVVLLENLLVGMNKLTLPANDTHRFFTMFPSMDIYRNIVRRFGPRKSVEILTAMRELVALNEFKSSANWLDLAENSEVFQKSFVRNAESYFAFKNAGSILRGLESEGFRKLSSAFSVQFQLSGRLTPHNLTFRFDHEADLPKRIAVIIGKNGVGKSQTLRRIVQGALKADNSLIDGDTEGRILVNRILAFAPTNEAGSVFPGDRLKRPRVWYRRFSLNRSSSTRREAGLSDLIIQLARSEESLGTSSRWDIFLDAIRAIDNWEQLCLPDKNDRAQYHSLDRLINGSEQRKLEKFSAIDKRRDPVRVVDNIGYRLSSGEISFLRFAAQASLHVENGSLLLLDEPETHLHPNFISQFVALLDSVLAQTGSAAIIATHSVYFVREVFQEQVTVLRTDRQGNVVTELPALRTFGADVGAISYFVFGEDEPSRLTMSVEARLRERYANWQDLYARYKDELSLEVLGSLRESIEAKGEL